MTQIDLKMQPSVTLLIVFFFFGWLKSIEAQVVKGNLKQLSGQKINLVGFNYYDTLNLGSTTLDSLGNFVLNYPKNYIGVAMLKAQNESSLVLLLTNEVVEIQGLNLNQPDAVLFKKSKANKLFYQLAANYQDREQAYAAWHYLRSKYHSSKELKKETAVIKAICDEINRIEEIDKNQFLDLSRGNYLKWYMPKRKLQSDMSQSMLRYHERIAKHIQEFRAIDLTNEHFKTSGLFGALIEGHYFLLENMGVSFDKMYAEMNMSTDYLVKHLGSDPFLLNMVSKKLFEFLEKRSLFPAVIHLSELLLNSENHQLEETFEKKLKKYAVLKKGNMAPDVMLGDGLKLSHINKNVLLIFGISTCSYCRDELQELRSVYRQWKGKLEIVYISLDENIEEFEKTYKNTPWKTYCDFKGWKTEAAKDYAVQSTPTYVLIDKDMRIIEHPTSLGQIYAWIQYKL